MAEVKVDGKRFSSIHELFEFLEEERANRPWIVKLWEDGVARTYRRITEPMRRAPGRVINVLQRARYGFGYQDLWSYDTYLAKQISKATEDLAEIAHGYPNEFQGAGDLEAWQAWLLQVSRDLDDYADWEKSRASNENYDRGVDAMHRIADKFGSLWD